MPDKYFKSKQQSAYSKGGGRPVYSYNPKDLEADIAIGVMLPFNGASAGLTSNPNDIYTNVSGSSIAVNSNSDRITGKFPSSYTTQQQALTNLKNLLLTYPGERYMQPTFGVRIKDRVFEPNTPELVIQLNKEIQDAINFWLPYIIIKNINIDNRDAENILTNYLFIKLTFRVTEQGANQTITLVSNGEQTTTVAESTAAY